MRIVNERGCVYVERRILRCFWYRLPGRWSSSIEAWNWVRRQGGVKLVRRVGR